MKRYKIAIVGAGPSGYFTAQAFQKAQKNNLSFSIDLIERLPTPWGLVRSGVAPDHQKIKTVSKVFEKIAKEPNFRLFANVELGKDLALKDLRDHYDAVVLATGAPKGRKICVPGENLANSFSAAEFVPWYNGHPDYADLEVDLNCDTAVIIGAGNVALDVARILSMDPQSLDSTDIALHSLKKLKSSKLRKVIVCGRRGPEHAAFTSVELRNLLKLQGVNVIIEGDQIKYAKKRLESSGELEKEVASNLAIMEVISGSTKEEIGKDLEIKFLLSPIEFKGSKKIEEIVFVENQVENDRSKPSEKKSVIKCGLVISAIAYESVSYSGIFIEHGRVKNIAGHVENNLYVTGWAKRGPIGVIGTNKSDSADVVDLIIKNLKEPKISEGITAILPSGHRIIDQIAWEKINAAEVISGEISGKPRIKETDWEQLLNLGHA
jgi:ferredoxin--NADP+ reductase